MPPVQFKIPMPPGQTPPAAGPAHPAPPAESFQPGHVPQQPVAMPGIDQRADAPKHTKGMSTGTKVLLVGAGLAAGIGGTLAVVNHQPAAPTLQVESMSRSEQAALKHLNYLNQMASKDGGGFTVAHRWLPGVEVPAKDVASVYQQLHDGHSVNFYEAEGEIPVTISNFDQLHDVAVDVKTREIEAKVQGHVDRAERAVEDFFENMGNIFR
ncbi:MAG: hypothetical protein AB7S38_18470 [Vulcanimicrobiota bacterium]